MYSVHAGTVVARGQARPCSRRSGAGIDRRDDARQEGGGIPRSYNQRETLPEEQATPAAAGDAPTVAARRLRVVPAWPPAQGGRALRHALARAFAVAGAILAEHRVLLGIIAGYILLARLVFRGSLHLFWFAPSELPPFAISALVVLGVSALRVLVRGRIRVRGSWWAPAATRTAPRRTAAVRSQPRQRGERGERGELGGRGHEERDRWATRAPVIPARAASAGRPQARAPLSARAGARLAWRYARFHFFRPVRLGGALLLVAALAPFMSAFVHFKRAIPRLHFYAYDPLFASLSRTLHGGRYPWQWLQPVVGHPPITLALDRIYIAWYGVVSIVTLWQAWSTNRRLRAQYALALVLTWTVLGTGLALLWSSVGPIYYGRMVSGPDPFAPLVQYLAGVDAHYGLYASGLQRTLWQGYVNPASAPFYEGISAMPSLHVALPVLFVMLARRVHRALFWVAVVFAAIIFIGSIALAWHYALDGYVATLGVIAIWWISGKLVGGVADERPVRASG